MLCCISVPPVWSLMTSFCRTRALWKKMVSQHAPIKVLCCWYVRNQIAKIWHGLFLVQQRERVDPSNDVIGGMVQSAKWYLVITGWTKTLKQQAQRLTGRKEVFGESRVPFDSKPLTRDDFAAALYTDQQHEEYISASRTWRQVPNFSKLQHTKKKIKSTWYWQVNGPCTSSLVS